MFLFWNQRVENLVIRQNRWRYSIPLKSLWKFNQRKYVFLSHLGSSRTSIKTVWKNKMALFQLIGSLSLIMFHLRLQQDLWLSFLHCFFRPKIFQIWISSENLELKFTVFQNWKGRKIEKKKSKQKGNDHSPEKLTSEMG